MSSIAEFPKAVLVSGGPEPVRNPLTWRLPLADMDRFLDAAFGDSPLVHPDFVGLVAGEVGCRFDVPDEDLEDAHVLATVTFVPAGTPDPP